eukprot:15436622-Alexandrium_andersonii.AAC.1
MSGDLENSPEVRGTLRSPAGLCKSLQSPAELCRWSLPELSGALQGPQELSGALACSKGDHYMLAEAHMFGI